MVNLVQVIFVAFFAGAEPEEHMLVQPALLH